MQMKGCAVMKKKKVLLLVFMLVLSLSMLFRFVSVSVYAVGDELEYNPSLRAAGVSPEAFADFPAEKRRCMQTLKYWKR